MTPEQIARVAYRAGFRGNALEVAVAVALAESGGRPAARGDTTITDATYGPSIGLWQIRSFHKDKGTGRQRDEVANLKPLVNARHAHGLYKARGGFADWSAYNNGAYKKRLGEARTAAAAVTKDAKDGELRGAAAVGGGRVGRGPAAGGTGGSKAKDNDKDGKDKDGKDSRARAKKKGTGAGGRAAPGRKGSGGPGRTSRITIDVTDLGRLRTGLGGHAKALERARTDLARTTAQLQPLQGRVVDPAIVGRVTSALATLNADGFGPPGTDRTLPRIGRQLDRDIDIVTRVRDIATAADGTGSMTSAQVRRLIAGLKAAGTPLSVIAALEAALLGRLSPKRAKGRRPVAGSRPRGNKPGSPKRPGTKPHSGGGPVTRTAREKKIAKIVKMARSQVGTNEAGDNRTKYGAWYGANGVAWCAIFVSWAFAKAGAPLGAIQGAKGFAGVKGGYDHFKAKGRLHAKPKVGDIMLIKNSNATVLDDHTGIVVEVGKDGSYTTVEGNASDAVRLVKHKLGDNPLYGFGRPF